jgi:hypothetical protein
MQMTANIKPARISTGIYSKVVDPIFDARLTSSGSAIVKQRDVA